MNDGLTRLRGLDIDERRAFDVGDEHATPVDAGEGDRPRVLATGPLVTTVEDVVREALRGYLPDASLVPAGVDVSLDAPVRLGDRVVLAANLYAVHPPNVTFVADVRRERENDGGTLQVGTVTLTLRSVDASALLAVD